MTARAGNVIGGGDFKINRIVPDTIKAFQKNKKVEPPNPQFNVRMFLVTLSSSHRGVIYVVRNLNFRQPEAASFMLFAKLPLHANIGLGVWGKRTFQQHSGCGVI